jgi:hypothetical protein
MCWYLGCEPPEDFDSMCSSQMAELLKTTHWYHHSSHQEAKYETLVPEKGIKLSLKE